MKQNKQAWIGGLILAFFTTAAEAINLLVADGEASAEVVHYVSFTGGRDDGTETRQTRQMLIPGSQLSVFAQTHGLNGNPFFGDGAAYQD